MVKKWEKELLLLENIRKRLISVVVGAVVIHIMRVTKLVLPVVSVGAKKSKDILGKTRK